MPPEVFKARGAAPSGYVEKPKASGKDVCLELLEQTIFFLGFNMLKNAY